MATKKELQARFELNIKTLKSTLSACGLDSSKADFSQEEVNRFSSARKMIAEEGKTYVQVAERFGGKVLATSSRQKKTAALPASEDKQGNGLVSSAPDSSLPASPTFDVPALQSRSAALGLPLDFGDLFDLLDACGCTCYAEQFDASEVERFDEAVELVKQGKTLSEIREQFVAPGGKLESFSLPELVEQSKQKGAAIGYYAAVQVIRQLGLDPNTKRYTPAEAKVILAGFELEEQGAPLDQLRLMNVKDGQFTVDDLYEQFAGADGASTLLQAFQDLADAQAKRLGPMVTKMKLASLARELKEGEASRQIIQQFRDYSLARIEGKSREEASRSVLKRSPTSKLLRE